MSAQRVPKKDRNVNVSGNVIASVINTGNYNKFFIGDYESLKDTYIDPWQILQRVELSHFTGREWLLADVDSFIEKHDRGYLIVEGDAGVGKTAFLAWLVMRRDYLHHFCELAPGRENIGVSLKNIATQIVLRYSLKWSKAGVLPKSANRSEFLNNVLIAASQKRKEGQHIVIVIDALDEAGMMEGQNVLNLPQTLPEGVYVIVSQRPTQTILTVDPVTTPRKVIRLSSTNEQNLNDMRVFINNAAKWEGVKKALEVSHISETEFSEQMLKKSQGVWIYLHHVIHDINDSIYFPLDIQTLPDGLIQYYSRFFARLRSKNTTKWKTYYLPLLGILSSSAEPVSLSTMLKWLRTKRPVTEFNCVIDDLMPFLAFQDESTNKTETKLRFYHMSLHDFASGNVSQDNLLAGERMIIDEISANVLSSHKKIAEYFKLDESLWWDDNSYGLRNIPFHLLSSGRIDELYLLLVLNKWWIAQRKFDPSGSRLALSLDDAIRVLKTKILEKIQSSFSKSSTDFPKLYALTHLKSFLHGRGNSIPIEAIEGFVKFGEIDTAMLLADFMSDDGEWVGANAFCQQITRKPSSVLYVSKRAEAYWRIARIILEERPTDPEMLMKAKAALATASEILVNGWSPKKVRFLFPDMDRVGLSDLVGECRDAMQKRIDHDQWDSGGEINIHRKMGSNNEKLNRATDSLLATVRAMSANFTETISEFIKSVSELKEGGWFGGDLIPELVQIADAIAQNGNAKLAKDFLNAVARLHYEFEDQRARSISSVLAKVFPLLERGEASHQINTVYKAIDNNDSMREEFKILALSSIAHTMKLMGSEQGAKSVLADAFNLLPKLTIAYDKEFALEALAHIAVVLNDRECFEKVLFKSEYSRFDWTDLFWLKNFIRGLSQVGAVNAAWALIESHFPGVKKPKNTTLERTLGNSTYRQVKKRNNAIEWIAYDLGIQDGFLEALTLAKTVGDITVSILLLSRLAESCYVSGDIHSGDEVLSDLVRITQSSKHSAIASVDFSKLLLENRNMVSKGSLWSTSVEYLLKSDTIEPEELIDLLKSNSQAPLIDQLTKHELTIKILDKLSVNPSYKALGDLLVSEMLPSTHTAQSEILNNLDQAVLSDDNLDQKLRVCAQVAIALAGKINIDRYLSTVLDILQKLYSIERSDPYYYQSQQYAYDEESAYSWEGRGHLAPEAPFKSYEVLCGSVFACLNYVHDSALIERAIGIILSVFEPKVKAFYAINLARACKKTELKQIGIEFRQQTAQSLRDFVISTRNYYLHSSHVWDVFDDVAFLFEIAEAMAILEDFDGLQFLYSQVDYSSNPIWEERANREEQFFIFEGEVKGAILGHMIELGYLDTVIELFSQLTNPYQLSRVMFFICRILYGLDEKLDLDWFTNGTKKISDKYLLSRANLYLIQLNAKHGSVTEAWKLAELLLETDFELFSGHYKETSQLRNEIDEVVHAVSMLPLSKSEEARMFFLNTLPKIGNLRESDSWEVLTSLFPVFAKTMGKEAATESWIEIEKIRKLKGSLEKF